jgi:hypothetical protein
MARKALLAALWIASLVAVAYWRDVEPVVSAQPGAVVFKAQRIASDNGFALLKVTTGPYRTECFVLHQGEGGVALAPMSCPS